MRDHEQECVARALGCPRSQLAVVNVTERLPTKAECREAAAIMVGGSGAFHVYDDHPWIHRLEAWLGQLIGEIDRPFLGMCFGHQAILKASGATIINDPACEELGTFELNLTEAGKSDPLFRGIPQGFDVQLGHVDRCENLPQGWLNLANSSSQKYQAVRLLGQPVWGFQFHAELRMQDNLYRVRHYSDHYGAAREEVFDALKAKHRPSPVGTAVMRGFARVVHEFWENTVCVEPQPPSLSL
jgi:GMP synthase (glutamine-hydrolysing)